jgi:autotransporter passenger strand-loop-strand repeat protein
VNSGGQQLVSGGTTFGTVVSAGGSQSVYFDGVASGTVVMSGGGEFVASHGFADSATVSGGTLELAASAALDDSMVFAGSGGKLIVDGTNLPVAIISGFSAGDTIDLRAYTLGSLAWLQGDPSIQALQMSTASGGVASITFAGNYSGQTMEAVSDGDGGTDLILGPSAQDLAQMSLEASNGSTQSVDGYHYVTSATGQDGFFADLFTDGSHEVVAFGSQPNSATNSLKSLLAASSWITGTVDADLFGQVSAAAQYLNVLSKTPGNPPLMLTGQSVGGAIAQILGAYTNLPVMAFNAPQSGFLYNQFSNFSGGENAFASTAGDKFQTVGTDDQIRMYGDQVSVTGGSLQNADMWTIEPTSWVTQINSAFNSHVLGLTVAQSHDAGFMQQALAANAQNPASAPIVAGIAGPVLLVPFFVGTPANVLLTTALGPLFSKLGKIAEFIVNGINVVKGVDVALDPSAATSYAFICDAGKPQIASVTLPILPGVDHYEIETEQNGTWSANQAASPMSVVNFATDVGGVSIQAYDASGNVVVIPDGFIFDLTFDPSGSASGELYTQLDLHWSGVSSDWSASQDWTDGREPDATANAIFDANLAYAVTISGQQTALSVALASPGATVQDGGALSVGESVTVAGGLFEIDSGGALSAAQIVVSGGTLKIDAGATLTVEGGEVQGAVVDNSTLVFDVSGSVNINGALTGSGTLVVSGGGDLEESATYSGSAQIDGTATLEFSSTYVGVATFAGPSTGSGGTLKRKLPGIFRASN